MQDRARSSREIVELAAFSHYLRTGERFDLDKLVELYERKFNPYHDPEDGRFTFGPGSGNLTPGGRAILGRHANTVSHATQVGPRPTAPRPGTTASHPARPNVDPVAKRQRDIGALAAKYESESWKDRALFRREEAIRGEPPTVTCKAKIGFCGHITN